MIIAVHHSDKPREVGLARSLATGAKAQGHQAVLMPLCAEPKIGGYDIGCFVGVKSKRLFDAHRAAGIHTLMLDKGYIRTRQAGARVWEYWRIALDAHQPTDTTLMRAKMGPERWDGLGLKIEPWRKHGRQIVIAGSSAKYHDFYGLPDPTTWARELFATIRQHSDRPVIYRPKPSWKDAVPIAGTAWSGGDETIKDALWGAHCVITHGSNACFEAAIMGVPSVVLGDAVARPISSTDIASIERPEMGKREQWLHNLAWHQFTEDEMRSGLVWRVVGGWLKRKAS
jgi:hypothetical protein